MKKAIAFLAVFLLCTASAYAQTAEVKINLPDTFMKTQEYGEAYFNAVIINKGETADFHLEYSNDGFETVNDGGTYKISGDTEKIIRISDNIPKGSYIMSVRVTSGEDVSETSVRMAVMEKYKPQFMDDYTRIGVHLVLPIPNITKSTYIPDKQRVINSLKLLEMSGIRTVRLGTAITWEGLENENGELNDTNAPIDFINSLNSTSFLNISTGNTRYGGTSKTREQIEKNVGYMKKRLTADNPKTKLYAELGNEPDLEQFWTGRDIYGIQYMNLARYVSLGIKDVKSSYPLIGGVTSGGTNAAPFLKYMFDQDAYRYLDGYSYHPYIKSSTVDGKYDSFTKPYEEAADGHGGWLMKMITEIGWNSAWEGTSSAMSHEQIAVEMVKVFLKTYLHDLDLTCYYSLVNNLGLQPQNDFSVSSAAVVAAGQITNKLNSALYIGEFPLADGIMCAMFIHDGEPLMAVWMPGETAVSYTFNTDVRVEDIYGNEIYNGSKVTIDNSVYYISGFGRDYVYAVAEDVKNKAYDKIIEKYGDKFNTDVFDEARTWNAQSIASDPFGMVNAHYNAGDKLIDEYLSGNTSFELPELTEALYELQISGEKLADMYAMTVETGSAVSEKYSQVQSQINSVKGGEKYSSLLYTDKIMKFAQRFYNKAKDAESREYDIMRSGIISSCSLISERLSCWAEKIMPLEEPDDTIGILSITEPMQAEFYQSTNDIEVKYTLDNKRLKGIDGEIVIVNGDGTELDEPVPVSIEANEYRDITINVPNDKSNKESDMYKIRLVENGKILNEKWFPVTRQKVMEAELAASQSLFSELHTVEVKLTNNTPDTISGTVKLTAPEGWALENDTLGYELGEFETKLIPFTVKSKKQVPFNMYSFGMRVEQSDGTEMFSGKVPLNFSVVIKSDKEYDIDSFIGDITDWQNAYPLYAGAPEDPDDTEQWRNSDVAAVAFYKYDDNYIYILTNVYDNIFHGKYTGTNMWRSDSMQMLFDPLNNAGTTVQSDDIAFITGCTVKGREFLKTLGPNGVTAANNVSYENIIQVVRDDSLNLTRYLIKIPFSTLLPLEGKQGTKFRTNVCFNDSDVEDRSNYTQITKGLVEGGTKRNPSLYYEFVMKGYDSLGEVSPSDCRLDLTMGSDQLNLK